MHTDELLKNEYFKTWLESIILDEDVSEVYHVTSVIDDNEINGFLFVSDSAEELDNHCDQCIQEPILFFAFKKDEDFPHVAISGNVGITKFNKVLTGDLSFLDTGIRKIELRGRLFSRKN